MAGQQVETDRVLEELAQLASGAEDYNAKRAYLEAVRSCKIIPLKTREKLPVCFGQLCKYLSTASDL